MSKKKSSEPNLSDYIYTTAEVAEMVGCKQRTVQRIVKDFKLGRMLNPRMRLLSAADVEVVRENSHEGPGQPKKTK